MKKRLYSITIKNTDADDGYASSNTGRTLPFKPTLKKEDGFNPGELLAFSWATCIESTLRYVLELHTMSLKSYTEVDFHMELDEHPPVGYQFYYEARLYIETDDFQLIDKLVKETHQRCPISKLLQEKNIKIEGIPLKKALID
jgi:organic hydroperoxide reductase OsmC/OhrA